MKWAVFEYKGTVTVISYKPRYRCLQFFKMKLTWEDNLKYSATKYIQDKKDLYLLDIECEESDLLTHIPSELWL